MSSSRLTKEFPPIRALLFDMDGLLLNSEDILTTVTNIILERHARPPLPWSIKARMQGRPGPESAKILHSWAQLPITNDEYYAELRALQELHLPNVVPLPGVEKLLEETKCLRGVRGEAVEIALATSSHASNFKAKTAHLEELFGVFPQNRRILGDDPRIKHGRGKPAPDIYLLALEAVNATLAPGVEKVRAEECLVFEDSVPGVEAGRKAGMRVVWVPHAELKELYAGREEEVLAGRTGEYKGEEQMIEEVGDGWGTVLESLEDFPWQEYGILLERSPAKGQKEEKQDEKSKI